VQNVQTPQQLHNLVLPARWWSPKEADGKGLKGERLKYWQSWDMGPDGKVKVLHVVVAAGRRSLKTEIGKRRLVLSLPIKKPWDDPRYFYGAPTEKQAKRIAWNDLQKLTPAHWVKRIYRSDLCIVTKWGSELWVVGLDKPQRVEGMSWDGCVLDERADIKLGAWTENIEPSLADREGWSRHIGVPDFRGPASAEFQELYENAIKSANPDWLALTWKSSAILKASIIENAKRNAPGNIYRQEYEASFESAPGRAYYEFSVMDHVKPTLHIPDEPVHIGCDFNVGHHNWGMYQIKNFNGVDRPPMHRIFDEIFLMDAQVENMIVLTKDKLEKLDPRYLTERGRLHFYGDISGDNRSATATRTAWRQIRDAFPTAMYHYRKNPLIHDRLSAVNGVLRNAKGTISTHVDPKCKNHIRDFQYVTSAMLFTQNKSGELTHATDCFGYFVKQYRTIVEQS
jgi:hypothetical protein